MIFLVHVLVVRSPNHTQILADFDEGIDGLVELGGAVGGADLCADAGFALGDDGVEEADREDAVVEQLTRKFLGQGGFAEHDGSDGVILTADGEAGLFHRLAEVSGVGLDLVGELGGLFQHAEHFQRGGDDHGRDAVREKVGARALAQQFDDFFFAGSVAAGSTA